MRPLLCLLLLTTGVCSCAPRTGQPLWLDVYVYWEAGYEEKVKRFTHVPISFYQKIKVCRVEEADNENHFGDGVTAGEWCISASVTIRELRDAHRLVVAADGDYSGQVFVPSLPDANDVMPFVLIRLDAEGKITVSQSADKPQRNHRKLGGHPPPKDDKPSPNPPPTTGNGKGNG